MTFHWGAIRALPILSALADRPYSVPEVGELLLIPVAVARRILQQLEREGFVELVPSLDRDERRRYQLSDGAFDFAYELLDAGLHASQGAAEADLERAFPHSNHDRLGGARALVLIAARPRTPGEFQAATGLEEKPARRMLRHLVSAGFVEPSPARRRRVISYRAAVPAFELALKLLDAARHRQLPIHPRPLGEALRAYRVSRPTSQPDFAELIGLPLATYREVEMNTYEPDLDELCAWADRLRVDPLALVLIERTKDEPTMAFRAEVADPARVLQAIQLLTEHSYSTPEMSQALGVNPSLARRMLQRLVKAGFVELVPYTQVARYQLADATHHLGLKLVTAAMHDERQRPVPARTAGESVRAYRRGRGLSLITFAKMIRTNNVTLGRLERGEHTLTLERLQSWSARLGIDVLDLLLIQSRRPRQDGEDEAEENAEDEL